MFCPVDKEAMIILEYADVEVDYCVQCGGIWLDAGELELLFGDRALIAGFLTAGGPATGSTEKKRRCPICRKKMAKVVTGGDQPVLYDQCPNQHGLWFDAGELGAILEHGSDSPGGEAVTHWLREMFPPETTD